MAILELLPLYQFTWTMYYVVEQKNLCLAVHHLLLEPTTVNIPRMLESFVEVDISSHTHTYMYILIHLHTLLSRQLHCWDSEACCEEYL